MRPFLEKYEAESNLLPGSLEDLYHKPAVESPLMLEARDSLEQTVCVALFTQINLIVTRGPEEIWSLLADKIKETGIDIPGVIGPSQAAEKFAIAWSKAQGCQTAFAIGHKVYKLNQVIWPSKLLGQARLINLGDVELVTDWARRYAQESAPWEQPSLSQTRALVKAGMTYVWEDKGVPVAMASLGRPTKNGISVKTVYTPPEYRKQGYGTALVAAVSAEGLRRGKKFCVLYAENTNLANSIYQTAGYEFVTESSQYVFCHYNQKTRD